MASVVLRSDDHEITIEQVHSSPAVITYALAATLLADTPPDGTIGYAQDTDLHYLRQNSAWVQVTTGSDMVSGASALGGDVDVFKQETAGVLEFRGLTAGDGITVSEGSLTITISSPVADYLNDAFVFVAAVCACDGVTDDTVALQAALTTGKSLWFPRGATLLVSGPLTMVANQRIIGNGSVLKRAAQVSTTTSTSITAGVTNVITVADASGFRVGQSINLMNGSTYDQSNRVISDITGNVITTTTTWNITVSGSTTVYDSFYLLTTVGGNVIENLKIDGNRDNRSYGRWETSREVYMTGDHDTLRRCELYEMEGETIQTVGDNQLVEDCYVHDANGSAVHFSSCSHTVVRRLRAVRCNEDESTTVGHNYGCLEWSVQATDTLCEGCYLADSNAGFGNWLSADSYSRQMVGCVVRDCTWGIHAISGASDEHPAGANVLGCRFYNSPIEISMTQAASTLNSRNWLFSNCYFENSNVILQRVSRISFVGCEFVESDTAAININVVSCWELLFDSNRIHGGRYAIYISDAEAKTRDVTIRKNQMLLQYEAGPYLGANTFANGYCVISENLITNDSSAAAGYWGIASASTGRVEINNNTLLMVKGDVGILLGNNNLCRNNSVRVGAATYSIRTFGGSTDITVLNNLVDKAVSDGGGGANLVDDNDVIAA